jgi:NAD(P)-dependent dehydrogenase (short-subunit alcohol dehydrogenase family)
MEYYRGKTAVVTGGASGIGRALCEALGRFGSAVIVADTNADGAREVAAQVTGAGGQAEAVRVDVTCPDEVRGLVERAVADRARLDFMFNNAGVGIAADFNEIPLGEWRRIVDINLFGVIHGTMAAYSVMSTQGGGHIVNTASLAGLTGLPTSAPYATTKAGIVMLSTSLRHEGEAAGVRVSVACPGFVNTAFYDTATVINADRKQVFDNIPVRMIDAGRAARIILRGVARNKSIIVFPFLVRMAWWLYRIHPALLRSFNRNLVRGFRAARRGS